MEIRGKALFAIGVHPCSSAVAFSGVGVDHALPFETGMAEVENQSYLVAGDFEVGEHLPQFVVSDALDDFGVHHNGSVGFSTMPATRSAVQSALDPGFALRPSAFTRNPPCTVPGVAGEWPQMHRSLPPQLRIHVAAIDRNPAKIPRI